MKKIRVYQTSIEGNLITNLLGFLKLYFLEWRLGKKLYTKVKIKRYTKGFTK